MAQQYKFDILTYTANGSVKSDCADITFFNQGRTIIVLNNSIEINAGSSLSFTANANEIDKTIYNFSFKGTGANRIIIFRKIYI